MLLKPATIERLKNQRKAEQKARREDTIERLREKIKENGPDSIYVELLQEYTAQTSKG